MIATRIPWYSCGMVTSAGSSVCPSQWTAQDALPHRRIKEAGSARRLDRFFCSGCRRRPHNRGPNAQSQRVSTAPHAQTRCSSPIAVHVAGTVTVHSPKSCSCGLAGSSGSVSPGPLGSSGSVSSGSVSSWSVSSGSSWSVSSGSSGPPGSPGCTMPPVSSPGGVLSQAEKAAQPNASRDGQKQAQKFFHTFPCLISISLTV